MISDPIADMFTRIRNAYMAGHKTVKIPYSGFKEKVLRVLLENGYLSAAKKEKQDLKIDLKYKEGKPAITKIQRVSKPSLRVYKRKDKLPYLLSGLGVVIVNTNQGVMTAKSARKKGLGGEVICKVW